MDVRLIMVKKSGEQKEFPVVRAALIGRGDDCDLRVPLANVSRHHCKIKLTTEGVLLKDLGSSNGTFVNGKKVGDARLKAGDRLGVGPVQFKVEISGTVAGKAPAAAPTPVAKPAAAPKPAPKPAPKAKPVEEEEIVELETTIGASAGIATESEIAAALQPSASADEEDDAISALEALAGEDDDDDDD